MIMIVILNVGSDILYVDSVRGEAREICVEENPVGLLSETFYTRVQPYL
jgi:hypothetical protein